MTAYFNVCVDLFKSSNNVLEIYDSIVNNIGFTLHQVLSSSTIVRTGIF